MDHRIKANIRAKKYYRDNRSKILRKLKRLRPRRAGILNARAKAWKDKNRARYLAYGRDYARWYRNTHHRKFVSAKLKAKYGVTLREYETAHRNQGGKCAICKKPNPYNRRWGRPTRLAIDHHHGTNEVRGLLCHTCNNGLGCFKDDSHLLEAALAYLKSHSF